jgi:hypothetical protein
MAMDSKEKSPLALAVIARLKGPKKGDDAGDGGDESSGDDKGVDEEAQLAACEDAIAAIRDKDARALRDAWNAFCDARGDY